MRGFAWGCDGCGRCNRRMPGTHNTQQSWIFCGDRNRHISRCAEQHRNQPHAELETASMLPFCCSYLLSAEVAGLSLKSGALVQRSGGGLLFTERSSVKMPSFSSYWKLCNNRLSIIGEAPLSGKADGLSSFFISRFISGLGRNSATSWSESAMTSFW